MEYRKAFSYLEAQKTWAIGFALWPSSYPFHFSNCTPYFGSSLQISPLASAMSLSSLYLHQNQCTCYFQGNWLYICPIPVKLFPLKVSAFYKSYSFSQKICSDLHLWISKACYHILNSLWRNLYLIFKN